MGIFVSFNDSSRDPTYAEAEGCSLVMTPDIPGDDSNPCIETPERKVQRVPILPDSPAEIELFCEIMGWETSYDDGGMLCIRTHAKAGT